MSNQQERWLVAFIVVCIAVSAFISHAQEKDPSYPQTRQWTLSEFYDHGQHHRVTAIDTAGVCLYVVLNDYNFDTAIAAVPKTQLGKGVGCQ